MLIIKCLFLWTEGAQMKKVLEECPQCGKETTHRKKRKSYRSRDRKSKGYVTVNLPLKCMACGYIHGQKFVRNKGKKKVHISFR